MTTNQAPQEKSEALSTANKMVRNWLIVFLVSALLSAVSAMVGPQNALVTAVMVVSAAAVVWEIHKREVLLQPVPIPVHNNVVHLADHRKSA